MDIGQHTFAQFKEKAAKFHGYPAPGLLVGAYMVEAAKAALPEGTLFEAVVETGKCLPDAVQLLTLCSTGNQRLKVVDLGKYAVSLYDKHTGEGFRAHLDTDRLAPFPEIEAWFLKRKPKAEQDPERLFQEIEAAGNTICAITPVKVNPRLLGHGHAAGVAVCPKCKEAFPSDDGRICRGCQGEAPYRTEPPKAVFSADRATITGVVLAQGASSRLGRDKCSLRLAFPEGEMDLLTRTVRLLGKIVPQVYVVGRECQEAPWFPDDTPGKGPVGGLETALRRLRAPLLVLPVDLPFMDEATLAALVNARKTRRPDACVTCFIHTDTGQAEPLVAIYEPTAHPLFARSLREEKLKVDRIIPASRRNTVPCAMAAALPFFGINCPADYEAAKLLLEAAPARPLR